MLSTCSGSRGNVSDAEALSQKVSEAGRKGVYLNILICRPCQIDCRACHAHSPTRRDALRPKDWLDLSLAYRFPHAGALMMRTRPKRRAIETKDEGRRQCCFAVRLSPFVCDRDRVFICFCTRPYSSTSGRSRPSASPPWHLAPAALPLESRRRRLLPKTSTSPFV